MIISIMNLRERREKKRKLIIFELKRLNIFLIRIISRAEQDERSVEGAVLCLDGRTSARTKRNDGQQVGGFRPSKYHFKGHAA